MKKRLARDRKRLFIKEHKETVQCVDCPPKMWWPSCALDYDHVRGEKLGNVGMMVAEDKAMERIVAEIEKCEVVCAGHHRIRTELRAGRV